MGSGFWIKNIPKLSVCIARYKTRRGGCLSETLPQALVNKKCLLTIETETDCFMYSVMAGLFPRDDHRGRTYPYQNQLELIDFSKWRGEVSFTQIDSFERKNQISISVFTYDEEEKYVIPIRVSKNLQSRHVRLFWFRKHYYLITNFKRLLNSRSNYRRFHCERCLSGSRTLDQMNTHYILCSTKPAQKIVMPFPFKDMPRRNFCERKDFKKETKHPIIIYADFECLSVRTDNAAKPFNHIPCSYGYVVVDWKGQIIDRMFEHGENIVPKFLMNLKNSVTSARAYVLHNIKPLQMTVEDELDFTHASICWICEKELGSGLEPGTERVRDHDHFTGKYRGAAHQKCNVNYSVPGRVPIFFHNLKGYDGHIIMDAIKASSFEKTPKIIPNSMEKYIGWYVDNLAFLDSYAFLAASLSTLSGNLTAQEKEFYLRQEWKTQDLSDLLGKATLPYEYLDSFEKFKDSQLPPKSAFFSSLNQSNITDDMYHRLERIWHQFNCSNLGDLIDIYLRLDVIMLAAIFENFRKTSLSDFGIDPPHYMTAPGLSYAAALKKLKISIELFTDIDMLMMIEGGIRGGFTTVAKRHVIANNPGAVNYDGGEKSYIMYFDVNNLYGNAMMETLPLGDYKWVNFSNEDRLLRDIYNTPDDGPIGYILEIDLEYPRELHDLHNDFPLAPHKMRITKEMHSPYAKGLIETLSTGNWTYSSSEKLVSTFLTRERYTVHYRNLKFYLDQGLSVIKVHRVIQFKQKPWLRPYIEFCTKKRQ